jgi:hypothetical protein
LLAADFQRTHGRPANAVESLQLAQQASLETREAKHEPRSLAEQRTAWFAQAVDVLGGPDAVQLMVKQALKPAPSTAHRTDTAWLDTAADQVLAAMEKRRSTWQVWHVRAEAQRRIRTANVPALEADRLVDLLVHEVLSGRSVCLARPDAIVDPKPLQRSDGASVYTVAGADLFTSTRILDAERRLVAIAGRRDGQIISAIAVGTALLEATANGITLNAGQAALVRAMSTSGTRLQVAIAPAGTGKTAAMRALATAWRHGGGTVMGLAPTAAAAAVLRDQIHAQCETLANTYSWNTVTYTMGSHDQCGNLDNGRGDKRHFVERFGGRGNRYARAKARMAWAIGVASKGTPMLFMGSECHLDGYWHDGPDLNGDHRFDWSIAGDPIGMSMRRLVQAANQTRWNHLALRNGGLEVTHRDPSGVIAFKRWNNNGDVVLVVVNASDTSHTGTSYGVATGQAGRWQQILCSQDAWFGGWDGAGNAFYDAWTQADGRIYINVPQWSVVMFRLL